MMKKLLVASLYALVVAGFGFAVAQNLTRSVQLSQSPLGPIGVDTSNGVYFPAKVMSAPTTGPVSPVGTGLGTTVVAAGSDFAGEIIIGTSPSTTGNIQFRSAYTSTPYCTASLNVATPIGLNASPGGISFNAVFAAGQRLNFICIGRATG